MSNDCTLCICGSRDIDDYDLIKLAIELGIAELKIKPTTIIHGGAKGVDKIAGEICKSKGYNVVAMPANWNNIKDKDPKYIKTNNWGKKYNCMAGFERNKEMVDIADALIAINLGTNGTNDSIKRAKERGIPLYIYVPDEDNHEEGYIF